jgi:hypothetical protein
MPSGKNLTNKNGYQFDRKIFAIESYRALNKYLMSDENIANFKFLIHTPSTMIGPTFLLLYLLNPKKVHFIFSKEAKSVYEENYDRFTKFFKYEILPDLPDKLKKRYDNFPQFTIEEDILSESEYINIEVFKSKLDAIIKKNLETFKPENIIIDITGGKKINSAVSYNYARENSLTISYINVDSKNYDKQWEKNPGTEKILIELPNRSITYVSLQDYPLITINQENLTLLYEGRTLNSSFRFDKTKRNQIIEIFKEYSDSLEYYARKKNGSLLIQDQYYKIEKAIRECLDKNCLDAIDIIRKSCSMIVISMDEKNWQFPFEFIFNRPQSVVYNENRDENISIKDNPSVNSQIYKSSLFSEEDSDDIIITRSIPAEKLFGQNDLAQSIVEKQKKVKILLICACSENTNCNKNMYAQYKELKAFFSKRNDIDFVDLYLPDKKEFIESLKNADIAHIICHGTILEDGQQGLLLEKEKYAFDKPELFEGDVDMVKTNKEQSISEFELALQSGKTREELEKDYYIITKDDYKNKAVAPVLFLNACYSLNIQIDWDNSLFSEFINSGVKNIIGTHWVVPQNAAKEVSKDFYINLLKGDTIGQSLKKSLEKQSDPFIRRNYYILGNHQISLR